MHQHGECPRVLAGPLAWGGREGQQGTGWWAAEAGCRVTARGTANLFPGLALWHRAGVSSERWVLP